MVIVGVAVLPVVVIEQSAEDHTAAGAATGDRGIGLGEACAGRGQSVEVGRADRVVAVATHLETLVVDDDEHDVLVVRRCSRRETLRQYEQTGQRDAKPHEHGGIPHNVELDGIVALNKANRERAKTRK